MSDDKNELADHNHSPYRACEDFDVTNKQRPKRQTFAEIVAAVDSTSSVLSEVVVIKPGVFNGSTLYDPEGRELVPTDGRALEPAGVQLAVLAGARLVWDACGCAGGIATTWRGLTELLLAKKLNVLCLDSAKATLSKWKYSRVAAEMFFSRVAEFGGAISSGNSEPSQAGLA